MFLPYDSIKGMCLKQYLIYLNFNHNGEGTVKLTVKCKLWNRTQQNLMLIYLSVPQEIKTHLQMFKYKN